MRHSQQFRYVVAGLCVTGSYVILYPLLRAAGLSAFLGNALAYGLAIVLQYFLHASYTFGVAPGRHGQWLRFGIVIALGYATSLLITSGLAPRIGMPNLAAAAAAALLIPAVNWVLFRAWVFRTGENS